MKIRFRDYLSVFFNRLVKRPTQTAVKQARYVAELGGKDGYEVNGIGGYWGRYASTEKIVELAKGLTSKDDWFTFYLPAAQYDGKYSHRIGIYHSEVTASVDFEFTESSSQCGSYVKNVALEDLESEIRNLRDTEKSPESQGFVYEEW